jgi:hypothetical protein
MVMRMMMRMRKRMRKRTEVVEVEVSCVMRCR